MVAFAEEQHSSVQTVYSPVKQAKPAVPQNVADIEETILPQPEAIRIKINDKWLQLSKEFVASHPGGSVITQYKDADATHIFHAFHEGSAGAYKQLVLLEKHNVIEMDPKEDPTLKGTIVQKEVNIGAYEYSVEQEKKIVQSFETLRQRVHSDGLMDAKPEFYLRKIAEAAALMTLVFVLQYAGWYLTSACVLALVWQQLGWLTHEFCHHQPLKNRRLNDVASLLLGNVAQGFSRDWWKNKHNTHHAATNIIDQDDDIDMTPLIALVPDHLKKFKEPIEQTILRVVPYQHLYYTLLLPILRVSWTAQSLLHVFTAPASNYKKERDNATLEQVGIALHWAWVFAQLYFLPTNTLRLLFFAISQLGGGFLIAMVVTYNHNSVDKYPEHSRILNNFAALHILTTRNMNPSPFVDWFFGGLNYQIEHHLFPTMPRPNLGRCSVLVKAFCAEVGLPYLQDDYWTGYAANLKQLENVAKLANKHAIN